MNNIFQFDVSFQEEILQFTVTDLKSGLKALQLYESQNFKLIEHGIIADALKGYYKTRFTIPSKAVIKEELRNLFNDRRYKDLLTTEDKDKTLKIVNRIYARPVKDGEVLFEAAKRFAQYSAVKETLEDVNLDDFTSYKTIAAKLDKAINTGNSLVNDPGLFIIAGAKERVIIRQDTPPGFPTPFWQINSLLNNGGTMHGNVIVVLGPAKRFKTGLLLNIARGYLKMGKTILIADFENGQDSIGLRADQAIVSTDRKTLLSGQKDKQLLKILRRYKRFGGEIIIKRFSAGATAKEIEAHIKLIKDDYGIVINNLLVDYPDLMGDSLHQVDEVRRISQVYIDLKNLGKDNSIESIWCPSHVNREGDKKQGKRFVATDIAKAMDKIRHVDMILGMNQSEEEKAANIIRLELVDQRDGPQDGRAYFWVNFNFQQLREMTKTQAKEAEELRLAADEEAGETSPTPKFVKKETSDV